MRHMGLLKNASTGTIIATRVDRAASFLQRAVGLLARPNVRPDEGLWIERCNAIHTMAMRSAIDVICVDDTGRVKRVVHHVKPHKLAVTCFSAKAVIELGAGTLEAEDVLVGDLLELV